mmetsp:Transcript_8664/g.21748  ORF Transcript_8664/g.21748 Transcript_8664/m.21748 type:complete len:213 (-) Transcript_8664:344-982(-)
MEDPIAINDNATGSSSSNEAIASSDGERSLLLKKLHEVSDRGVELVRMYASIDPTTTTKDKNKQQQPNPWKDPETMLLQLKQVRDELTTAWNDLEKEQQKMCQSQNGSEEQESEPDEEQLRVLYMDMVTDAFGDVLDQMRQQEATAAAATTRNSNDGSSGGIDVDLLVDCLQNGMEFLDPSDRNKQFFEGFDDDDDDDDDEEEDDGDDDSKI